MSGVFADGLRSRIEALAARYPRKSAALLPALHLVQAEKGFIGPEDEEALAGLLETTPVAVREVVTFYTMFRRRPVGRHLIQVCTNVTCALMGGDRILDHLRRKLGIEVGETTPDGRFTLTTVECLGTCEAAPGLMIDFDHHGGLTETRIDEILERLD